MLGTYTMLNAITTLRIEAPKAAMIAMARINVGNAIIASMNLWTIRSVFPPKWTLMTPTIIPMVQPMKDENRPTTKEILVP